MIELNKISTTIPASVDEVYKYVTNLENYGDWFPGVREIRSKNHLPHATVGKTYLETLLLPDGEYQLTIEVAQCETNRFFLTKGDLEGVLPQMTIIFSDIEQNLCGMTLQYASRSSSLTEKSDIVRTLKKDLADRSLKGVANLKEKIKVLNK